MQTVNSPSVAQQAISTRAMLRRRVVMGVITASLLLQQACYNAVPVVGAATIPQGEVTLVVNDRGRTLMGSRLGTLLDQVTGRIVRADSLEVEVAVNTATDVRGSMARWGGERFVIPREGIGQVHEKKVSKKRSWLLAGVIIGSVALLLGIIGVAGKEGGQVINDGEPI